MPGHLQLKLASVRCVSAGSSAHVAAAYFCCRHPIGLQIAILLLCLAWRVQLEEFKRKKAAAAKAKKATPRATPIDTPQDTPQLTPAKGLPPQPVQHARPGVRSAAGSAASGLHASEQPASRGTPQDTPQLTPAKAPPPQPAQHAAADASAAAGSAPSELRASEQPAQIAPTAEAQAPQAPAATHAAIAAPTDSSEPHGAGAGQAGASTPIPWASERITHTQEQKAPQNEVNHANAAAPNGEPVTDAKDNGGVASGTPVADSTAGMPAVPQLQRELERLRAALARAEAEAAERGGLIATVQVRLNRSMLACPVLLMHADRNCWQIRRACGRCQVWKFTSQICGPIRAAQAAAEAAERGRVAAEGAAAQAARSAAEAARRAEERETEAAAAADARASAAVAKAERLGREALAAARDAAASEADRLQDQVRLILWCEGVRPTGQRGTCKLVCVCG